MSYINAFGHMVKEKKAFKNLAKFSHFLPLNGRLKEPNSQIEQI